MGIQDVFVDNVDFFRFIKDNGFKFFIVSWQIRVFEYMSQKGY